MEDDLERYDHHRFCSVLTSCRSVGDLLRQHDVRIEDELAGVRKVRASTTRSRSFSSDVMMLESTNYFKAVAVEC